MPRASADGIPVLEEYESCLLDLTRGQAEALQEEKAVDVAPAVNERWRITANSTVGALDVAGVRLLIRPKIHPENLFLLLEPGLPAHSWRSEAFEYDTTSDLLPAVIALFTRALETTLGRGLLRSYETRREPLVALRGRLDTAGQFRRAGLLLPVSCTYDDFTEDIVENRVLRATVRRVLRLRGLAPQIRGRLMRQLVALEGVSDAHIRPEVVDALHITRLNEHYVPALRLARLLLANLTLIDRVGGTSAPSFTVDMNDLFQRFVTERLRTMLRGRLDVIDEPVVHLGEGRRVAMYPDLVFRRPGGGKVYVGDIKYKLSRDAHGRSGDYYQLLAYTTALELSEGALIYCRRPGETPERTVTVRNAGKRLVVRAVDLSGSTDDVESQMLELAENICGAAIPSARSAPDVTARRDARSGVPYR